jgi:hypothetical protein
MKTRYNVMSQSSETNEFGKNYPDVLSYDNTKLFITYPLRKLELSQRMKERFYLACHMVYGSSQYDDIILWFNNIDYIHYAEVGRAIYFPDKRDLDTFLSKNRRRKNK